MLKKNTPKCVEVGELNSQLPKTVTTRYVRPLHHKDSLSLALEKYMSTIQGEVKIFMES